MVKFLTDASPNWGRFSDSGVDELYAKQKVERDAAKRIDMVKELQRQVISKGNWLPGLWWTRIDSVLSSRKACRVRLSRKTLL